MLALGVKSTLSRIKNHRLFLFKRDFNPFLDLFLNNKLNLLYVYPQ